MGIMTAVLSCIFVLCTATCRANDASHIISDAGAFQPSSASGFLGKPSATSGIEAFPSESVTRRNGPQGGRAIASITAPPPNGSSSMGMGTLVIIAVLATMALCCVLGCCMMKQVCGCLFGGVEDAFDGDGQIGHVAQAEEAALAGLGGYELAGKSLF